MMVLIVVALMGIAVSFYGLYVEHQLRTNPLYKPVCDLNDRMSCTKPLLSEYSSVFGVSNTYLGLAYYAALIVLALMHQIALIKIMAVAGIILSAYFAYLLVVKIKTFCLLCTSIYLINLIIVFIAFFMVQY